LVVIFIYFYFFHLFSNPLFLFFFFFFFFNDTATTEIYTVGNLSLHDALPILEEVSRDAARIVPILAEAKEAIGKYWDYRSEEHTSELQSLPTISYAVFCL